MHLFTAMFRIALEKSQSKEEKYYLTQILTISEGINALHQSLTCIIRAGQVYLGKPHPNHSRSKKKEITEYSEDLNQIEKEQIKECEASDNAIEIYGPLYGPLEQLISKESHYRLFSPDDMGLSEIILKLVEKQLELLERLLTEMNQPQFLKPPFV